MPLWICAACAVEYPETQLPPDSCAICEDERQYVPRSGQAWHSLEQLRDDGFRLRIEPMEPGLTSITTQPSVGIGQTAVLAQTPEGNLLWDPPGFIDDAGVERVRELGGAAVIAASHPHMFGAQVSWSRALGGATVLVAEADRSWVRREDPAIQSWSGELEVLPGITLRTIGGHFPGSAVAYVHGAADRRGVLLAGDTLFPGPSGVWVTFMRSYPNAIPMSAAVVDRVATAVIEREFDRIYGNFGNVIETDARAVIRRSADRYMAWVSGQFDHLT
jgi:glyoxylase-like metal-dependent hydrolase (beta-lactamase superfamily II)